MGQVQVRLPGSVRRQVESMRSVGGLRAYDGDSPAGGYVTASLLPKSRRYGIRDGHHETVRGGPGICGIEYVRHTRDKEPLA